MPDMIFRGEDPSQEVEEFIRQVRAYALEHNKYRDDRWVAEYASTRLSGAALLWYEGKPEKTRQSWEQLHTSLLMEYGKGAGHQYPTSPDEKPTGPQHKSPRRGRIAILDDQLGTPYWLGHKPGNEAVVYFQGSFYGTTDISDSLLVTVVDENRNPQELLLRLDSGNHLAIKFLPKNMSDIQHSPDQYAILIAADLEGKSPYTISTWWEGQTKVSGWQIKDDGTLLFNLPTQAGLHTMSSALTATYSDSKGNVFVEYATAPTEFFQKWAVSHGWRACRLAFEQI